jgi:hypothetical protein
MPRKLFGGSLEAMQKRRTLWAALAPLLLPLIVGLFARSGNASLNNQGSPTAFTYQGCLVDGGNQANGLYDLQFALYDAPGNGNQQGNLVTNSATVISNGLFAVVLDFGNQFPGTARWLEVSVRTNGGGAFTTVVPRQPLTQTPYAIQAGSVAAGGIIGSLNNSQLPSGTVTNGAAGVNISGSFSGNGAGLTNAAGSAFLPQSNGVSYGLRLGSGVSGFGTNQNLGEFWASDWGFSPTNTDVGNSAALDACIFACSNSGGGTIRFGSRFTSSPNASQIINLAGEHLLPWLGGFYGNATRIKMKGDGTVQINSTASSTRHAVLWGTFDAEDFTVVGRGTNGLTYPFTNYVGIYEVGYSDPELRDVHVISFGQGIACEQLGSFRGAQIEGCEEDKCGIGIAIGDQCDQIKLTHSPPRTCLIGWDLACIVPDPTDNPIYATVLYEGSNVGGSSGGVIDGGIADYNGTACMIGKGNWHIRFYAGNTKSYQMQLGHPSNLPIVYPNQGGNVTLDECVWGENPVDTNILINAQGVFTVRIYGCGIGGPSGWHSGASSYGIVGEAAYVEASPDSLYCGTNYLPLAWKPITAYGFAFNSGAQHFNYYDDHLGGPYVPGETLWNFDANIGFVNGANVWSVGAQDGSGNDRSRISYTFNYGTNDQFYLNNVQLYTTRCIASTCSNLLAPVSISIPGSPFFWTNASDGNINVLISGGALQGVAVNGARWAAAVTNSSVPVQLQRGEWMVITNTVAPIASWKPF